jgi:hypothetical protein
LQSIQAAWRFACCCWFSCRTACSSPMGICPGVNLCMWACCDRVQFASRKTQRNKAPRCGKENRTGARFHRPTLAQPNLGHRFPCSVCSWCGGWLARVVVCANKTMTNKRVESDSLRRRFRAASARRSRTAMGRRSRPVAARGRPIGAAALARRVRGPLARPITRLEPTTAWARPLAPRSRLSRRSVRCPNLGSLPTSMVQS